MSEAILQAVAKALAEIQTKYDARIEDLQKAVPSGESPTVDIEALKSVVSADISKDISDLRESFAKEIDETSNGLIGLIERAVDNLTGRIEEIQLTPGANGEKGQDGAGIITRQWADGVYRADTIVQHNLGQFFVAKYDTASEPGTDDSWERLGAAGFRHCGTYDAEKTYQVGDLYIKDFTTHLCLDDGKSIVLAYRGPKGAAGERGLDGAKGEKGDIGATIKNVMVEDGSLIIEMSDGGVHLAPYVIDTKAIAEEAKALLDDAIGATKVDTPPLNKFMGFYQSHMTYDRGDVVRIGGELAVCFKAHAKYEDFDKCFIPMLGTNSGGGGGGGGIARTSTILADGTLNMGGYLVSGLGNPRNGQSGDTDAVNKLYMQQAIAAGTLFQGVYRPAGNAPDLGARGDTGFSGPAANTALFAPPGAPLKPTDPLRVAIWFQVPDVTFPLTLAAPKHVTITLSNGQAVELNVPAGTYADQNALIAAYLAAAKAANPLILNMIIHRPTGALWMAVETLPAVYATSLSGQIGGGFPVLPPGAKNTILNSYSWNIQTTDPNLPEYLPAGLPGIAAGTKVNNSDLLQYNANLNRFEIIRGGNLTQGFADNRYWQLARGNMAWQDQPYDNGAVVYGQRFNAWFVATQNIVPGSAEPGTTAAGAIWRKINSTYGSTIFFGKGDYDTAHTDAAHNWGMPAGTYPSGQQPLNGDSYYDITSGSEAQFVVTQNNPVFVITGVTTVNTTNQVGTLTHAQMDTFQPAATPLVGQYYYYDAGTAHTASGGAFNGVAFTAGHKYLIVWSGDKDADHNGWVAVDAGTAAPAAASTHNWTINTPHPQAVPDTITPRIVWGYKRVFNITIGASVAADTEIQLLRGIPEANADTHIEIKRTDANGSTYVFDVLTVISGQATLSPIAIKAQDSKFKQILCNWEPGKHFEVGAVVDANAHGTSYQITVTTYDYDIGLVQVGDGVQTMAGKTDQIKADQNYPNEDLQRLLRAASGDATASVVKQGIAPGADVVSTVLGMDSGRTYRYKGWAVGGGAQCAILLSIMASKTDSNQRVDFSKFTNVIGFQTYTDGTTSKIVKFDPKTDGFGTQTGFFGLTAHAVEAVGSICYIDIEIDKRNPTSTVLSSKATYQTGAFNVICQFSCLVPTAEFNGIYFSGIGGAIPKYYICKE